MKTFRLHVIHFKQRSKLVTKEKKRKPVVYWLKQNFITLGPRSAFDVTV